jgi:phage baseplate assembly protein W
MATTQGRPYTINLAPQSRAEEIIQNLYMLITTPAFTVSLDRSFGLDSGIIDKPVQVAETLFISELYKKIGIYEPRAEIVNISFTRDEANGRLIPRIEVRIHDK